MEPDNDAGRAMRNERYFPAYVRVVELFEDDVTVGKIGNDSGALSLSLDESRSGVIRADDEDKGRFGRDEVRSKPWSWNEGDWLSMEDSVFDRSMRHSWRPNPRRRHGVKYSREVSDEFRRCTVCFGFHRRG